MYSQLERLNTLLNYLREALDSQKKININQALRIDKDIILKDNARLNVYNHQVQYVVINHADKWVDEAKQITQGLLGIMPSPELPLPEATMIFRKSAVAKALERTNGHHTKAAKLLGMSRNSLHYVNNK